MGPYIGIMNANSLNEAIVAGNGLWRHFRKFPKTHKPLIGLGADFILETSGELSKMDKLAMAFSAIKDSAKIAVGYGNNDTNNPNLLENLKMITSASKVRREISAFYFDGWQNVSAVNELKSSFPEITTILSIDGKDINTPEKAVANVALYGKNLDEILIGVSVNETETPESLYHAYTTYSTLRKTNPGMQIGFTGEFRNTQGRFAEVLEISRRENCSICLKIPSEKGKKYSLKQTAREFTRNASRAFSYT